MTRYRREEKKRRTNPTLPVIGLFLAVIFVVIAYILAPIVVNAVPQLRSSLGADVERLWPPSTGRLIFTIIIWVALFGVGIFLVAILSGKDQDETEAIKVRKEIVQRQKERRRRKKRGL